MDVCLASPRSVRRFFFFIFGIQEFVRHRSLRGEYEHSSFKNMCPSIEPQKLNSDVLENDSLRFWLIFGHLWRQSPSVNLHGWYLHEIIVRILGAQKRNVYFIEIGLIGSMDFIAVRYLLTKNGLPNNTQFRFQGAVVEDSVMRKCVQFILTDFFLHISGWFLCIFVSFFLARLFLCCSSSLTSSPVSWCPWTVIMVSV
jgi:hypothetical protein